MSERPVELIDETELRRALRLDPSELPPPLDVAAIVARARERGHRAAAGALSSAMAALAVAAIIAAAVEALRALAPALLAETYADTVMLVARGAVAAELALPVLQQPSLPVALLAALVFAIALEYRSRRESLDVVRTT